MSRRAGIALVMLAALLPAAAPAGAAPKARANLMDIEMSVMCTSCHEPLALAQSPQAQSEKQYIAGLIGKGLTKQQILSNLVGQYGVAVLGKPPASGFNLTVYIVPPALVLAGIALLALTLPKWRERARRAAANPLSAPAPVSAADQQRLDRDLERLI